MDLQSVSDLNAPSPICRVTLRVHAFRSFGDGDELQCRDCHLVMPLHAALRDGPEARHCLQCGWWSPEEECRAGDWCVWCKEPFDE